MSEIRRLAKLTKGKRTAIYFTREELLELVNYLLRMHSSPYHEFLGNATEKESPDVG
jgi:hypothetical protein